MLIPNRLSTLGSGTSSLRPQVFQIHRPVIKAKYRSFVPTATGLLVNIIDPKLSIKITDDEILNAHSMETQTRTHEIPERPNGMDSFITLNTKYTPLFNSSTTCPCIRSHRTEDISVREDENGIRSHFCPLNRSWDAVRDENEDYPDEPMRLDFDVDLLLKGCSLRSEDIPCLVAEKPTLSECEDVNSGSDVDATTSMIYALTQNRQLTEDSDDTLEYLYRHKTKYFSPHRGLDEKTMTSWIDESSDDTEYYTSDRETEMPRVKFSVGSDSDMEEFEDSSEKENDFEISRYHTVREVENKYFNDVSKLNEIPNNIITDKEEYTVEHSSMINSQTIDFELGRREVSAELGKTGEMDDKVSEQSFKADNPPRLHDDLFKNNDTPQTEVEHALPLTTRLCPSDTGETLENPSSDSSEKIPCAEPKATKVCLPEDSESRTVIKREDPQMENTSDSNNETNFWKCEGTDPKSETESKVQIVSAESQATRGTDVKEEDKRDNLAMEPVDLHSPKVQRNEETQPDLATALRFMTEIYPTKDEEELYSDTLSTSDIPSEVPKREKSIESIIPHNYEDIQHEETTVRSGNNTSPSKSSAFEPVLTEDKRTGKQSRNKFSKFFKSFKRRLAKKV